jgi:hypothetical protein
MKTPPCLTLAPVALALLLLTACGPAAEKPAEFVDLFDGQSLDGWTAHGGGNFYVADGTIVGESMPLLPNSFLHTNRDYANFELELEIKIDPLLNSGIQIRSGIYPVETTTMRWGGLLDANGERTDIRERVWEAGRYWGYQVEIDPTERGWSGALYEEGGRGFLHPPGATDTVKNAFKPNDWNHVRVIANGDHFQTWINGVPVADVHDGLTPTGTIALQLHGIGKSKEKIGQKVWLRHVRLKEL